MMPMCRRQRADLETGDEIGGELIYGCALCRPWHWGQREEGQLCEVATKRQLLPTDVTERPDKTALCTALSTVCQLHIRRCLEAMPLHTARNACAMLSNMDSPSLL